MADLSCLSCEHYRPGDRCAMGQFWEMPKGRDQIGRRCAYFSYFPGSDEAEDHVA